ncbi:hypothetical protein CK203_006162 [Vitis vinifera]|uniref:Uncharacterized protein n=1 Tax=Vitis vinifera TaxID=29760 RepID=A0A438K610_VITVI|nr:hypothetical protein CK203_006162 [Vitis vinifera]
MLSLGNCLDGHSLYCLLITTVTAVILQAPGASSIVAPSSNCYALDNSSHIFDFSSWLGQPFEYDGKDSDLVVRFCKDVESRSQTVVIRTATFLSTQLSCLFYF